MMSKRLCAALTVVMMGAAMAAWIIATYLGEWKIFALLLLLFVAEQTVPRLVDKSRPWLRRGAWLTMALVVGATYLVTVFVL